MVVAVARGAAVRTKLTRASLGTERGSGGGGGGAVREREGGGVGRASPCGEWRCSLLASVCGDAR